MQIQSSICIDICVQVSMFLKRNVFYSVDDIYWIKFTLSDDESFGSLKFGNSNAFMKCCNQFGLLFFNFVFYVMQVFFVCFFYFYPQFFLYTYHWSYISVCDFFNSISLWDK